jgi:hypothetical protein
MTGTGARICGCGAKTVFIVIVGFMVVLALIVRCPATDARDGAIALRDARALPKFPLECRLDLVTGEAKMRVFSIALIAFAALTQAQAQGPSESKTPSTTPSSAGGGIPGASTVCGYSINGYYHEVANGKSLCWRSPFPYGAEYALLRCYPPLQEITLVKRGDPRCGGQYEMRQ